VAAVTEDEVRRLVELGRGPQRLGLLLALLGTLAGIVRATAWPEMPRLVPATLVITAVGMIGIGILRRLRYGIARIKETKP
jgi:hypothetical protein